MDTQKLRKKILDLAIRGKLVPQDSNDEPASILLDRIRAEKQQMVVDEKLKAKDIKNDSIIFRGDDNLHYEKVGDGEPVLIENEIPFELPQGWAWGRLSNVGQWQSGATPSKTNKEYYDDGTIPWLLTGDLNDNYIDYIPNMITQTAYEETSVKLNPVGSVLIAMYGATIGKLGMLSIEATTNQACCACVPYDSVNKLFLFFFLMSHRDSFIKKGEGGAQPNISKEKILTTIIPVPPLAEQERIVASLDEYLSEIDSIEQAQSELEDLFTKTRSKILDLAIRGKLVPQDPNDEPASVLLERIHVEKQQMVRDGKLKPKDIKNDSIIFRGDDNSYYECFFPAEVLYVDDELPFELPEGWVWSRLSMLAASSGGKTPSTSEKDFWDNGTVPWVTSKDMKSPELYSSQIMMTEKAAQTTKVIPPNSVLVVTRSGILQRTLPVAITRMRTTINQDIKALIPYRDDMAEHIRLALISQEARLLLTFSKAGTTVESIDFERLYHMPIPVPPLAEQERIFNTLHCLL